ncbi:unnamed protein product [Alternaria alternata]
MSLPNETTVSVKQKMNDIFESAHMMKMKSFFDDVLESVKARKRQQLEQNGTEPAQSELASTKGSSAVGKGFRSERRQHKAVREDRMHPEHLISVAPIANVPMYSLPPDNEDTKIFGREEVLENIHRVLFEDNADTPEKPPMGLRIFVLSGPPGIGKSVTARKYVRSYKHTYDVVAWLTADTDANLNHGLAALTTKLINDAADETDMNTSLNSLFQWLSNPKARNASGTEIQAAKWLLVLDDAKDEEFLLNRWPRELSGSILVIGRTLKLPQFLLAEGCDLCTLEDGDAARLFESVAALEPHDPPEPEITQIVKFWGGSPSAITRVATEFRNETRDSGKDLRNFSRDQSQRKDDFLRYATADLPSMAAVWTLDKRRTSEKAFLGVLAMLHPQAIPEEITAYSDMAKIKSFPKGKKYEKLTRPDLLADRLLEYDEKEKLLYMDNILRDAIKVTYLGDVATLSATFNTATCLLGEAWHKSITAEVHFSSLDVRTIRKMNERLVAHVDKVVEAFQSFELSVQRLCATRDLARLLIEAAWYRMGRRMFAYTKHLIDCTNLTFELTTDEMLDLQSASYNTSGAIALACNDQKLGLEYNTRFHDVQKRIFTASGKETTKLAASFSELGMAYVLNDQSSDNVLDLFEKSEAIRRRLPNFTEANLYNTLRGRGYTYLLRNDLEMAYSTFLRAMRNLEDEYGKDHLKRNGRGAALLSDMGNVRYRQGIQSSGSEGDSKLNESFNLFTSAEVAFAGVDGPQSLDVADVKIVLARHIFRHGEETELPLARKHLESAIAAYRSTGFYQRELARASFLLGEVLHRMGFAKDGLEYQTQAKALRDDLVPNNVIDIANLGLEDFDELVVILKR